MKISMIVRWVFSLILISAALALIFNLSRLAISNYNSLCKLHRLCISGRGSCRQWSVSSPCLVPTRLDITWHASCAWSFSYFVLSDILDYFWTLLIWILLIEIMLVCFEHHFFYFIFSFLNKLLFELAIYDLIEYS